MTKLQYIKRVKYEIDSLEEYLSKIPLDEYVERGSALGKLNGLYTALIYAYEIEEK